jgi:transposase
VPEGALIQPNTLLELRRDIAHLRFVEEQTAEIENAREERLEQAPEDEANARILERKRISYIGIETADMLTHEVFSRALRDQRAVARYAGLTGSPDESGKRRREKGLARAGNARVRRGMIQLAWRFVSYKKESALVRWYEARVAAGKKKKTMIVALARKLLVALWRFVTEGVVPEGVALRPAQ